FFNQLISSIQFHYQRSKLYSSSLEEIINERTKELQQRSQQLQAETIKSLLIIDNIVEGTLVTDLEGNIIQMNNNAKKLLHIEELDITINANIKEKLHIAGLCDTLMTIIYDTSKDKKNIIKEVSILNDGVEQVLLFKSTLVLDKKYHFDMVVCLIEDITNKKLLDQFKNEFFNTISHDLKNPLTSVIGFLDMVLHGPDNTALSERHRKLLNFAFHSSEDLQRMISDLTDLVRLQTNKITLNKITFPIKDFVYDLEDFFYPKLVENNIELSYKVEPEDLLMVADYYRLKQVFANLIGNAIKSGKGIKIILTAETTDNHIIFTVEDTGPGIPADKLPFIFEKFTQLNTYQDKSEGLGLGLSIVKTLINLHNGTISVKSELNKGTKFIIHLPKA
ncbi:MAG: HAMP domain-containing sensor histidine kinase, partial [Candidatus Margulisbacteria bacterium]|nr:HAMP domain-containing sensor histidine kinase [Candidatus Margulisiibacteriota bacterium]